MKKWIITFTEHECKEGVVEAKSYGAALIKAITGDWLQRPEDTGDGEGADNHDAFEAHMVDGIWEAKDS
jgi:hypothetical protein